MIDVKMPAGVCLELLASASGIRPQLLMLADAPRLVDRWNQARQPELNPDALLALLQRERRDERCIVMET